MNILGGLFESDASEPFTIYTGDQATVTVFGTNLQLETLFETLRRLSGVLADGTPIDVNVVGDVGLRDIDQLLQPGDANQDYDFDQLDLIQVQQAAKYITELAATWGEGDWNAAPGGFLGSPPVGDGRFDQLDVIAALRSRLYLTGPYRARFLDATEVKGPQLTSLNELPEPSTAFLLTIGLAVFVVRRGVWLRWHPLVVCAALIGLHQGLGRTIDTDTVYDHGCTGMELQCGQPLIVVDGESPPTRLEFVEPGFLALESQHATAITLQGMSQLVMSGGTIWTDLKSPAIQATQQSSVDVSGGNVYGSSYGIIAADQATVAISSGTVMGECAGEITTNGSLQLNDDAHASILGGRIIQGEGAAVSVTKNAALSVTGGHIDGHVRVSDNGSVNIDGGIFENTRVGVYTTGILSLSGESTVSIRSGSFTSVMFRDGIFVGNATLNIFGGTFTAEYFDFGEIPFPLSNAGGTINIFGHDLKLSDETWRFQPIRRLTGSFADGSPIDFQIVSGDVVLHEVPEPTTALLSALAFLALVAIASQRKPWPSRPAER